MLPTVCLPADGLDCLAFPALTDFGDDLSVRSPHLEARWTSGPGKELDTGVVGEATVVRLGVQPGLLPERPELNRLSGHGDDDGGRDKISCPDPRIYVLVMVIVVLTPQIHEKVLGDGKCMCLDIKLLHEVLYIGGLLLR